MLSFLKEGTMNGPILTTLALVAGFQEFDQAHWKHERGMATVDHAIGHFMGSTASCRRRAGLNYLDLAGVVFEAVSRLLTDVSDAHSDVAQGISAQFTKLTAGHISPGGVDDRLNAWFENYVPVNSLIVSHQDKKVIPDAKRQAATLEFVSYLMNIGVVAVRMTASHRGIPANEINQNPGILLKIWEEAGSRRLEVLRAKFTRVPDDSHRTRICPSGGSAC
jgi:hypothetical protein